MHRTMFCLHTRSPTTLDLLIAAHTLLLIIPPLPDTLTRELVENTLADHAKRIQTIAFGNDRPKLHVCSSRNSIWNLVPSYRTVKTVPVRERTPEDAEHEKLTWVFFGLALGSVIAYFAIMGSPIIAVSSVLRDKADGGTRTREIERDRWGWWRHGEDVQLDQQWMI